MKGTLQKHFLVVTYRAQGHINPAIHLANRLVKATGARITFSTTVSAHRKMFPSLAAPDQEYDDGTITYVPFSDGYDEGFNRESDDPNQFLSQFKITGSHSFSSIIDRLNSRGQQIDCVIYTFLVSWAAEVAQRHRIPSTQYWIQPATVFAIYYHSFHGYDELISANCKDPSWTAEFPCLPAMRIRDLPSFVATPNASDDPYSLIISMVKEAFLTLDRELEQTKQKPKVLVNTFDELESNAISAVNEELDLIAVGPILQSFPKDNTEATSFDLFEPDEKRYMDWLDSKPKKSVVYVAFGSLAIVKKQQMEEVSEGLKASGRPYLWVVRKDCRHEGVEVEENGKNAMVVEWCSQVRVLNHASLGCFVTHCGWNSTLESLVSGVPTVGVPQWSDQGTNAMLMERAWGTGVRGEINEDGVLESEELRRCLDLVLGGDERGVEIRRRAEMWKEKAREAVSEGGSSDRNLRAFMGEMAKGLFGCQV